MAKVYASIGFQPGDAPVTNDDPQHSFFIVYADASMRSHVSVHDDAWSEAEAFARAILEAVAARRARKAEAA